MKKSGDSFLDVKNFVPEMRINRSHKENKAANTYLKEYQQLIYLKFNCRKKTNSQKIVSLVKVKLFMLFFLIESEYNFEKYGLQRKCSKRKKKNIWPNRLKKEKKERN